MANQPVDLFQVALGMDPRFGENLPKDVADAFANGDVARVFRTSADLSPKSIPSGSVPMASQAGRIDGDYGGSIFKTVVEKLQDGNNLEMKTMVGMPTRVKDLSTITLLGLIRIVLILL